MYKKLLIGLCLFLTSAFGDGVMPTLTIQGTTTLTYQGSISQDCLDDLAANGCNTLGCVLHDTTLTFKKCNAISLTLQTNPGAKCQNSQAEFYLAPSNSTFDISLVNGYSVPVTITYASGTISAMSRDATGQGIYPYGCSLCLSRIKKDCGYDRYRRKPLKYGCKKIKDCQITNDKSQSYTVKFN